ncbi:MAG: copper resistance protein CopC [Caldilineaceae bacterium]|nr:copper resistance protein CopC [Caldilineaceae bacterium]
MAVVRYQIQCLSHARGPTMICALVLLATMLLAGEAVAHGVTVIRAEPAPDAHLAQSPDKVTVWFNEEVGSQGSTLQVFDAGDHVVDLGDGGVDLFDPDHASMVVTLSPSLPDGVYVVRWRVVLTDGDITEGEFSFSVGRAQTSRVTTEGTGEDTFALPVRGAGLMGLIGIGLAATAAVYLHRTMRRK